MTKRKRQPPAIKTLKQTAPRLPVLVRQTEVFELVVQGLNYEQICKKLKISEDTIARDMEAIAADVLAIVQQRHGEVLAVALATYQQVQQQAWAEYWLDVERERAWLAGELDYMRVQRVEKRLDALPQLDQVDRNIRRLRHLRSGHLLLSTPLSLGLFAQVGGRVRTIRRRVVCGPCTPARENIFHVVDIKRTLNQLRRAAPI